VFAGHPLPTLCLIRRLTGHRCPSCGLTRGVVYAARMDLENAVRAHPLAPVAPLLLLFRSLLALRRLTQSRRLSS
jgi:hypothetical protein